MITIYHNAATRGISKATRVRYGLYEQFAKKKKSNVRTCLNGAKDATGASQTFDAAKRTTYFLYSQILRTFSSIFLY